MIRTRRRSTGASRSRRKSCSGRSRPSRNCSRTRRRRGRTSGYDRYLNPTILVLLASANLTQQTNDQDDYKTSSDFYNNGTTVTLEDFYTTTDELNSASNATLNGIEKRRNEGDKVEDQEALREMNFGQTEIDEAVIEGLSAMEDLFSNKEPLLYKMGFYLNPNEPGAKLATFKEPTNLEATLRAKYGYATVRAALHLAQKTPSKLSRQTQEFLEDIPGGDVLGQQCPSRGVPRCSLAAKRYRTADGTCNNPEKPWMGAALLPLHRFLPPAYEDGVQSPRISTLETPLPSAREISATVHAERNVEAPAISLMFMQWGQFVDHEVVSTASSRAFNASIPRCCLPGGVGVLPLEFLHPECLPIPVPETDRFFANFNVGCLEFVRSAPATRIDCRLGWREQINQATSYIDASMIYGSDARRSESLRTFEGGRLIFGSGARGDNCRFGAISTNCFSGGDARYSEQPALTALHTIWVKFHNKIAGSLQEINAHWSDEKLYQESRRIVGALIQHITYREFLPIVLGPEVVELFELELLRNGFYDGYDENVDPSTSNAFATAAFRFGHSLVQSSFMRATMNHRIVPNNVRIHEEPTNLENTLAPASLDRLILGLINQPSQMRDEHISDELTRHLFQSRDSLFGIDLAAVNVQRGRDHGIPPYASWRAPCGLTPVETWPDLYRVMRRESASKFRRLYGSVDDIDLYSGGLAEKPVRGGLVGPVFACIIAQQFLNYRKGDRFWYENAKSKSSFSLGQLGQIRKVSLAGVICHTLGEVDTVQNFVFLTADEGWNPRRSCEEIVFDGLDLGAWKDEKDSVGGLPKNVRKRELSNSTDHENKLRHIGEYIMDTFEDYYDGSYDYEEGYVGGAKKTKKKSKKPSRKPLVVKKSSSPITRPLSSATKQGGLLNVMTPAPFKQETPEDVITEPSYNDQKFDLIHKNVVPFGEVDETDRDVLVLHDFEGVDPKVKIDDGGENKYEVNINIKYVFPNNVERTTKRNKVEAKRPTFGSYGPVLDNNKPYSDSKRPFAESDRPHSDTNKSYFTKPFVLVNLLQRPSEQTTQNPTRQTYLVNTKTTTRPNTFFATGYQIGKTTTNKYYDVPVFVSPTKQTYFTTKTHVQDTDYDPVYEDVTVKRPGYHSFPTAKPGFSKPAISRPIYVRDPIRDVYATILQKPVRLSNLQNKERPVRVDDKLDFKSALLPQKLKVKDTNLVKIYSVRSSDVERSSGDAQRTVEKKLSLPELVGTKIVRIEVSPSEAKFSTSGTDETRGGTEMPEIHFSTDILGSSAELPRQMKAKTGRGRG